ncbi:MAG TPA: chemotaxis protein CheW [Chromatiales bacterium]|nr:chemotaxis protein CheW [Chromatiales bacterium]
MNGKKERGLATQEKALTQYLDSLLMEIPETTFDEPVAELQTSTEDIAEVVVEQRVADVSDTATDISQQSAAVDATRVPDDTPLWGKHPFKALFFNVGETTLAAPLEKLGGILTECDEIKVMPGNTARYLGVILHRGQTVRVINFEHLVAELSGEPLSPAGGELLPPNRIILIEGGRIGIACRHVDEVETVVPTDVRWRSGTTKRPWYRGIVVAKMCALLDIDALLMILNEEQGQG